MPLTLPPHSALWNLASVGAREGIRFSVHSVAPLLLPPVHSPLSQKQSAPHVLCAMPWASPTWHMRSAPWTYTQWPNGDKGPQKRFPPLTKPGIHDYSVIVKSLFGISTDENQCPFISTSVTTSGICEGVSLGEGVGGEWRWTGAARGAAC